MATSWRAVAHRHSTRLYGPSHRTSCLSWIGDQRIAVGNLPTAVSLALLPGHGVTHVVNCRARAQTWISQDLFMERSLFGRDRVAHAPMWDSGRAQPVDLWSAAVTFAVSALEQDPQAGVLIHCQQGRRRSVMVAYAVLRRRGLDPDEAAELLLTHRREGELVPAYRACVEEWLAQ